VAPDDGVLVELVAALLEWEVEVEKGRRGLLKWVRERGRAVANFGRSRRASMQRRRRLHFPIAGFVVFSLLLCSFCRGRVEKTPMRSRRRQERSQRCSGGDAAASTKEGERRRRQRRAIAATAAARATLPFSSFLFSLLTDGFSLSLSLSLSFDCDP